VTPKGLRDDILLKKIHALILESSEKVVSR
jgi:hypothetical protein